MQYRVYNTSTGTLGRILDSTIGLNLAQNEVLLEVEISGTPSFDPETQYLELQEEVDLENNKWLRYWLVVNKTPLEIAQEDWVPGYAKRIVAPMAMITDPNDNNGVKIFAWFQAQGLPIEKDDVNVRLYCNTILPEHQFLVDMYEGIITIEDYPIE